MTAYIKAAPGAIFSYITRPEVIGTAAGALLTSTLQKHLPFQYLPVTALEGALAGHLARKTGEIIANTFTKKNIFAAGTATLSFITSPTVIGAATGALLNATSGQSPLTGTLEGAAIGYIGGKATDIVLNTIKKAGTLGTAQNILTLGVSTLAGTYALSSSLAESHEICQDNLITKTNLASFAISAAATLTLAFTASKATKAITSKVPAIASKVISIASGVGLTYCAMDQISKNPLLGMTALAILAPMAATLSSEEIADDILKAKAKAKK